MSLDPVARDWRDLVASQEWREAVQARDREVSGFVEVLDEDGAVLARLGSPDPDVLPATHGGVVDGQVQCDGEAQVRWTGDIEVDQDELVPVDVGDLLHPFSWNRVRLWWSLRLGDGSWGHVPCGTMYVDDPDPVEEGGPHVRNRLPLSDAAGQVKRALMRSSLAVGGMDAAVAAVAVLEADCPWLVVDMTPLGHRLPADFEAGEPDADPWDVAEGIVTNAGGRLYTDRLGVVVVEPDPGPGRVVASFVEGPGCQATRVGPSVALSKVCNEVTVTSGARKDPDGEELEPISATWRDLDPTSASDQGRGHVLRHRVITADEVTSHAQAVDLARRQGEALRTPVETVEVDHKPRPDLDPADLVETVFSRVGVSGLREVVAWSLRWGADGGQTTRTSGRREL